MKSCEGWIDLLKLNKKYNYSGKAFASLKIETESN